ncbi:MAG: prepilin-type N-terminal cleavage/methylation domain-containing protein [Clostridiales bacterium]|jgi:prepilin-type N-terminal cleavage/methylation domain-containing protein|nr:prepilin-type N-terminal cleavage/methylation domain-containing protein [Clostridiales bacterium]
MKHEGGFSLLEVIISVGILAIISGFILQMFIVSARVNDKARNIDIGMTEAINAVEAGKRLAGTGGYDDPFFHNCLIEGNNAIKYYDNSWAQVTDAAHAAFILRASIVQEPSQPAPRIDRFTLNKGFVTVPPREFMYDISVAVSQVFTPDHDERLLHFNAKKFFTGEAND